MTFFNQFHKEATERTMRKIAKSKESPMNSRDFAEYMKKNLETAKRLEIEQRVTEQYHLQSQQPL